MVIFRVYVYLPEGTRGYIFATFSVTFSDRINMTAMTAWIRESSSQGDDRNFSFCCSYRFLVIWLNAETNERNERNETQKMRLKHKSVRQNCILDHFGSFWIILGHFVKFDNFDIHKFISVITML